MKHRVISLLLLAVLLLPGCKASDPAETEDAERDTVSISGTKKVMKRYQAILDGSETFYSVDAQQEVTVEQLSLTLGENSGSDVKLSAFSIIDLDGDGESEVLLWLIVDTNHSYGYTVLHHEKDTVYGYTVPYQSLVDLRRDGTFSFYNGAKDRGSACMSFSKSGYEMEKITYCTGSSYYVDEQKATKEEFDLAVVQQSDKGRASWYHFTENNIQTRFET